MNLRISCYLLLGCSFCCYSRAQSNVTNENNYVQCGLNNKARQLAKLIVEDDGQLRKMLTCNQTLSKIAFDKAKEMASRQQISHAGSSFSNRRLVIGGYYLSKIYPLVNENNVEAVSGGYSDPRVMWKHFKESRTHRSHLLGLHEFYRLQNEIGVGYFEDKSTKFVDYWVVYIAHKKGDENYRGKISKSKN